MSNRAVNIILNGRDNVTSAVNKASRSVDNFRSTVSSATKVLGGFFAVRGGIDIAKWSISQVSALEQVTVSFETMLGSADKANKLMGQLRNFAATTPLEMEGIADATKKLLAFGTAQEDIIVTLRRLGDISSAIGMPLSELAEIYGKNRVQGRLFAQDINQLLNRGIPIVAELAKQFKVSEGAVRELVAAGKVEFKHLEKAIEDLTAAGSMFGGGMAKQSKTLAGQWSTLNDQIKEINNDLMSGTLPAIKALVEGTAEIAKNFADWAAGPEKRRGKPVEEQLKDITGEIDSITNARRNMGWVGRWLQDNVTGWNDKDRLAELRTEESRLRQQVLDNQRKARREREQEEAKAAIEARAKIFSGFLSGVAGGIGGAANQGGGLAADIRKKAQEQWRNLMWEALKQSFTPQQKKVPEEVKEEIKQRPNFGMPGQLTAIEGRFLRGSSVSNDPMLMLAKKAEQDRKASLKERREQTRLLKQIAKQRGLQPANLN